MDAVTRAIEQLLGRASGPLHLRLFIQPVIAIFFAIRTGLKDSRENNPPFLWDFTTHSSRRRDLTYSVWKDVGKLLLTAFLIDAIYQLVVLNSFYLLQALIVTFVLALLPYLIFRGIVTRLRNYLKH